MEIPRKRISAIRGTTSVGIETQSTPEGNIEVCSILVLLKIKLMYKPVWGGAVGTSEVVVITPDSAV